MDMSFQDWADTRTIVKDLRSYTEEPDSTPEGVVYFDAHHHLAGHIEIIYDDFYVLTISNESWSEYGDEGLKRLEQLLWDNYVSIEIQHTTP